MNDKNNDSELDHDIIRVMITAIKIIITTSKMITVIMGHAM